MIDHPFPKLTIRGRELLPIVQGGMGVGVSAHRLAGSVAGLGALGTIASVELRRLHADLMARTRRSRDRKQINEANLEALDREIRAAKELSGGRGMIAVNIMKAVGEHAAYVRQACRSGADAIVMGAGLPLDLPDLTRGHEDVALIPILAEERGVNIVIKRWARKGRLPDAVIIENPQRAGGHLGANHVEDVQNDRFGLERVTGELGRMFERMKIAAGSIPVIAAGGINSFDRVREMFGLGVQGVQLGTAFAVTEESDAHINFKRVLANARPQDIVTFLSSAGLPARAVLTPWLKRYLGREGVLRERATGVARSCALHIECLSHCGLKDGNPEAGQFCIDNQLSYAYEGDVERGLFFRGTDPLPFGDAIRPVRELFTYLLTGIDPRPGAAPA